MRDNDEMTDLFRKALADAEMPVADGFWEQLQSDPALRPAKRAFLLRPAYRRWLAAASVALVLGMASAAFYYLSPREEMQTAFTQVAALSPEMPLPADFRKEPFPTSEPMKPAMSQAAGALSAGASSHFHQASLHEEAAAEEDEMVSVRLSITIQQRMYANPHTAYAETVSETPSGEQCVIDDEGLDRLPESPSASPAKWAVKAGLGTALPRGEYHMPLAASATVERRLGKHLSLETGLQYSRLAAEGETLHTLAVPLRLNALLAEGRKLDFYATAGAAVEKCVAGAADNSFDAEPVQLSVSAGVGVRYRVNDRLALFAEPTVSHHFDTDSATRSLRTERPTNLNLLCGLRVTY